MSLISTFKLSCVTLAVTCTFSAAALAEGNQTDYKGEVAVTCAQPLMLRDGFYFGAQGGYDSYRVNVKQAATIFGVPFTGNPALSSDGFVGGLFAGFGLDLYQWAYLGAEIYANGSSASQSQTLSYGANSTNIQLTEDGNWGLSALPGVKVNDSTLLYVRLGWNQARLKTQTSMIAGSSSYNTSSTHWSSGFNYGLGLETAIYQNISLRGEVSHTDLGSFTDKANTKFTNLNTQFMLGLAYHFA